MSEHRGESNATDALPSADRAASTAGGGGPATAPPDPKPGPPKHHSTRRRVLLAVLGVAVGAGLWFGIPWVRLTLNTVSTDDAFVNGYVTFVAARVPGLLRANNGS